MVVINIISLTILIYFFIVSFLYILLIFLSSGKLKKYINVVNNDITIVSNYTKPISVIVPAYNEEETIIDNINSLLQINYPIFEIILVNDGSADNTLKRVLDYYDLRKIELEVNAQLACNSINNVYSSFERPELVVVDKINGGKSDAINAGINVSRYPLFCAIDADCVLEKNALLRIVKPFLKHEDTIAVGGIIRVANGCEIRQGKMIKARLPKNLLVIYQIIEYFRSFLSSRVGWESINALLIISGAFGVFKKSAVVNAGGYIKTIGEDMELTVRLHEYHRKNKIKYKVDFASDAVCWTQVPDRFKDLRVQRIRWHRGLIDSLLKHKKMLFNFEYGAVGILSMPYFFLVEMLGPVVETVGYMILIITIITGYLSKFFLLVFAMAYLYGLLFSLSAILLEQLSYKRYSILEIFKLVLCCFTEQLFYRQLTVWWRVLAFFNYREGQKHWGTIKRTSLSENDAF